MSKRGKLYFYDAGGKFNSARHSLTNLIDDCDICVYSLTPKGHSEPAWLIVKVTLLDCMDRYLYPSVTDPAQRCVVMKKFDYEKTHPQNLFRFVSSSTSVCKYNVEYKIDAEFYKQNGVFSKNLPAEDFFSMEADPESTEGGAQIYLRDKAFFVK